ncbi:hypothetical protein TrRE_jg1069 [Triparma retinervis]|uniref:Uncharacterized protein n=1 Tax=Triparma retinervis TaxID=2557542 RepID=A0A9W6ZQI2_9STRA|nr:hypothetical protein TrRE_jg1069 [Triparma retinervis]
MILKHSKDIQKPLEEQSYGLFDNLPLSYIVPPTPNKVPLYNACKSTSFPTALLAQTGYEVLAFILEPSISFPSSCTVVGGCAVIANVDKMDCQRIECTAGEAIMGSEEWGTPMFIDPMLFTADKPLLDEGSSPLPSPPPSQLTFSQYTAMSPQTKASFLLHSPLFNPYTVPRVRYASTKCGTSAVEGFLKVMLDATVRKAVEGGKGGREGGTKGLASRKQFAADMRDSAVRKNEAGLGKAWNEEFEFLRALQSDPTREERDILNDKDEWYERRRLKMGEVSNIESLLEGTGLEFSTPFPHPPRSLSNLPSPTTNEARMAVIFNSAGTVIRHYLPMVSKALGAAKGDRGLIQLVHVNVEGRIMELIQNPDSTDVSDLQTVTSMLPTIEDEVMKGSLISDHYECSEVRYGRLRGDWEKFEVWVQKSAAAFNVNERVSREVGERCSAMRRKEEDYGSPGSERKRRKVEGGGEEVSPLVERGGEIYVWIKEPVKI